MVGLIFTVVGILWRGYVLSFLWGWFMVPLGVKPVGVAVAVGLSSLGGMLTKEGAKVSDLEVKASKIDQWIVWVFNTFLWPLIGLTVGWICHMLG